MLSAKDNLRAMYSHTKIDVMPAMGQGEFTVYPVNGYLERPAFNEGGLDWFGCKWEYFEVAQAPAPDINNHVLGDICDWRDTVVFPDLDAWDWEKAVELDNLSNADRDTQLVNTMVLSGLFERLHILMGFENALCSLLTDPEEVEDFFDALTEYKIKLIDKLAQYYKPDVITYHDDWGMQKALFFAPEIWRELIKPRTKKIIDAVHGHGILFVMHSCGKLDEIIPEIAEIGVDTLQCMDINDIGKALDLTKGTMTIQASVHTQDFKALDSSGLLTSETVHDTVHTEFMAWGASGRYMPFILPPSTWYEEIIVEEYETCRQSLKGSYTS